MVGKTQTNVYDTHYHFVFATKYRQAIFTTNEKRNSYGEVIYGQVLIMPEHSGMYPRKMSNSILKIN